MNNTLIEHIKALNKQEQALHDERRKKAIEKIKELRQRTRHQQETVASADTVGHISQRLCSR